MNTSWETTMQSVTLEEAQACLPELLAHLQSGEEILITDQGEPLARLVKAERTSWPCKAGSARGRIRMAPDFDAPLEDFKEYMA
jgi:antitoxin (DNA-binding transcriptional repressor) of toxin-antitoxin stability system